MDGSLGSHHMAGSRSGYSAWAVGHTEGYFGMPSSKSGCARTELRLLVVVVVVRIVYRMRIYLCRFYQTIASSVCGCVQCRATKRRPEALLDIGTVRAAFWVIAVTAVCMSLL